MILSANYSIKQRFQATTYCMSHAALTHTASLNKSPAYPPTDRSLQIRCTSTKAHSATNQTSKRQKTSTTHGSEFQLSKNAPPTRGPKVSGHGTVYRSCGWNSDFLLYCRHKLTISDMPNQKNAGIVRV